MIVGEPTRVTPRYTRYPVVVPAPAGAVHARSTVVSVTPTTVSEVGGGFVVVVATTGPAAAVSTPSVIALTGYE